jgi:hypothetical protein
MVTEEKPENDTTSDPEHRKHVDAWEADLKASITDALTSTSMVLADLCGAQDGSEVDHRRNLASACCVLSGLLTDVTNFTCNLGWGCVAGVGEAMGAVHVQSLRGMTPKPEAPSPAPLDRALAQAVVDDLREISEDLTVCSSAESDPALCATLERITERVSAVRRHMQRELGGAS